MTRRTTRPPRTTWWATAASRTKLKTPKTHSHTLTHQEPTHQTTASGGRMAEGQEEDSEEEHDVLRTYMEIYHDNFDYEF